jgi:glycosyltransferase involved in cell wall biosynthesis
MPEVLGDAGVYFDPEQPAAIAAAVLSLIESPRLRQEMAEKAFERAQAYSWSRCAEETFTFLAASVGRSRRDDR